MFSLYFNKTTELDFSQHVVKNQGKIIFLRNFCIETRANHWVFKRFAIFGHNTNITLCKESHNFAKLPTNLQSYLQVYKLISIYDSCLLVNKFLRDYDLDRIYGLFPENKYSPIMMPAPEFLIESCFIKLFTLIFI